MRYLLVILMIGYATLGHAQKQLDDLFIEGNAGQDALLTKAKQLYANGFFKKAVKTVYRELKHDPDYFNGYVLLGYFNYDKQYFDQAALYFAKAIKVKPDHTGAVFMRGTCFLKGAKYRLALTDFLQCIRLDNEFYPAYNNIAVVRMLYQDLEAASTFDLTLAKQDLDAIMSLDEAPDNAMLFNMGFVYLLLWEFDQSILYFEKAIAADSSYAKAWFYRGMANYYKKDYSVAKIDFSAARQMGFQPDRCVAFLERLDKILDYLSMQRPARPEGW